ncbi:hypothetical protein BDQ12DRAFT_43257 [Crucibulum laeve]|uniref:Frag1/DRAM/Sfk1 family-domain-containing protein n=1 Tax=Crucibulum laeve TaxID=68775 RepID=A0A5C3MU79_9AGAR|nr:hypothetical protein BDQ12DRAFT_43257 [Crucibulum laeve]
MTARNILFSVLCFLLSGLAAAQDDVTASGIESHIDPYLKYRPQFARSLPVQILLTGVVLTLVSVLFIHLIFTAQYHWPLAPVNYVLQLSGVTTLLISLIATLHVVLSASFAESEKWPYMLSYIAVNVPPLDLEENTDGWSVAERATWLVMNASTSGLIQITHIQFLTLLYPSRLEGRLIFILLGPLAIVAAIMQLLPINGSAEVNTVASAVRNVCNATLSLLFTVALFIWGVLVNRKQAWRTDGGTAAFGCAALTLALVSTALNLLYVHREEEYVWLPSLMWAVVLWQSFLGWWWWVGAGSGSGLGRVGEDDMEEKLIREEKRELRRKEARERRQETKKRAKKVLRGMASAFSTQGRSTSTQTHSQVHSHFRSQSHTRSLTRSRSPEDRHSRSRSRSNSRSPSRSRSRSRSPPPTSASASRPHRISPTPSNAHSATSTTSFATLPRALPGVVHRWYASLRRAHLIAARQQAVERVERIRELERNGTPVTSNTGWGLGSFGWRIAGLSRVAEEKDGRRGRRNPATDKEETDAEYELYDRTQWNVRRREDAGERAHRIVDMDTPEQPTSIVGEGDGRPTETDASHPFRSHTSTDINPLPPPAAALQRQQARPKSVWWWGPLQRWRLQDSTIY